MRFNPFRRKPDPPTNEALLAAIVAVASHRTPEYERAYYTEVLKSRLLYAADPENLPRPILLVNGDDEIILPLFTDMARMMRVFPDTKQYNALPASELCRLALAHEIYIININPEHGPGTYLLRREIESLATGTIPEIVPGEKSPWDNPDFIPTGDSRIPTEELLEKLADTATELLRKAPSVEAGYIILLSSSDDEKSKLTIALHFSDSATHEEKTALTQQLVPAAEAVLGEPMRAVWLEGERLEAIQSRVPPFYRREMLH